MEQNNKVGNFGDLLKILLDEKELSMGELSKKSGIDKSTISRIANNKQKPN
ncbi:TPA: helix-turn-helix transcriptional regulator, partial [Clostridioides difficile]|nr:helix-turn-helix transcriptional regulator [Clostridioides difficile]